MLLMTSTNVSAPQTGARGQGISAGLSVALVAVFAALIWVFALVPPIPVGPVGVPITLQTLMLAFTGMVLGPTRGFIAVLLYLALGFLGLPVFSGGRGGIGVLAGPSAGFILGFPFYTLLSGWAARFAYRRFSGAGRVVMMILGSLLTASVLLHFMGIAGMSINGGIPFGAATVADVAYWPGDVIKTTVAALLAVMVLRAFPVLARR